MIGLAIAIWFGWMRMAWWAALLLVAGLSGFSIFMYVTKVRPWQMEAGIYRGTMADHVLWAVFISALYVAIGYGIGWGAKRLFSKNSKT